MKTKTELIVHYGLEEIRDLTTEVKNCYGQARCARCGKMTRCKHCSHCSEKELCQLLFPRKKNV